MAKESVVAVYFENLQACIEKYDLTDKPNLIFNIDEEIRSITNLMLKLVLIFAHSLLHLVKVKQ